MGIWSILSELFKPEKKKYEVKSFTCNGCSHIYYDSGGGVHCDVNLRPQHYDYPTKCSCYDTSNEVFKKGN